MALNRKEERARRQRVRIVWWWIGIAASIGLMGLGTGLEIYAQIKWGLWG